jgi:hypothetical protein
MRRPAVIALVFLIVAVSIRAGSGAEPDADENMLLAEADATEDALDGPGSLPMAMAYPDFVGLFDCQGSVLHQSYKGAQESPLELWFGVRADTTVFGIVTTVGAPLDLPEHTITGSLTPHYDTDGRLIGGRMLLRWPYTAGEEPIVMSIMRDTFIRAGIPVNGVGKILRRTSKHTYIVGSMYFEPQSHPNLRSLYRLSFITATCYPKTDLPPVSSLWQPGPGRTPL